MSLRKILSHLKAHPLYTSLATFGFTCISPYVFYGVYRLLNSVSWLKNLIKDEAVYLNYMAIAFTGVPSAIIAIYSLYIAQKSEMREQADKQVDLDFATQELHEYISNSCHVFCDVAQGYRSYTEISMPPNIEKNVKQLFYHKYLTEDEASLCESIHTYVMSALNVSREDEDSVLARDFCRKFLKNQNSFALTKEVERLLSKLNRLSGQHDDDGRIASLKKEVDINA